MRKPEKNTLSIKTHKSILEIYNLIKTKQYTEKHIKELLIDLRFVANLVKEQFNNSPYEGGIKEFIDLCNFIAHPIKSYGFIAKRINGNIDLLKQSLINPKSLIKYENGYLYFDKLKTYSCNEYIYYIFTMIFLALKSDIRKDELWTISEQESQDISLCILSLLQNSIIELDKKDAEKAVLILNTNDGYLFLYSIIYSETINKQLIESGFNSKADSSFFMLPTLGSNISHINVNQIDRKKPQFYETFRCSDGQLKLHRLNL